MGFEVVFFLSLLFVAVIVLIIWAASRILLRMREKQALSRNEDYKNQVFSNLLMDKFNIDKFEHYDGVTFAVDTKKNRLFIGDTAQQLEKYIDYVDIIEFEVIENGKTITENHALAGALLFGVTGAVVGTAMKKDKNICMSMKLKIIVNDIINPNIIIELAPEFGMNRSGARYAKVFNFVSEITSTLSVIKSQQGIAAL